MVFFSDWGQFLQTKHLRHICCMICSLQWNQDISFQQSFTIIGYKAFLFIGAERKTEIHSWREQIDKKNRA